MAELTPDDIKIFKADLEQLSKNILWLGDNMVSNVGLGVSEADSKSKLGEKIESLQDTVKTSIKTQTNDIKELLEERKKSDSKDKKSSNGENDSKKAEEQNKKVTDSLKEEQQQDKTKSLTSKSTDDVKTMYMSTNDYLAQLTKLTTDNSKAETDSSFLGKWGKQISSLEKEGGMVGGLAGMFNAVENSPLKQMASSAKSAIFGKDENEQRQDTIKDLSSFLEKNKNVLAGEEVRLDRMTKEGAAEDELEKLRASISDRKDDIKEKSGMLASSTSEEYIYQKEKEAKVTGEKFDYTDEEKSLFAEQIRNNMLGSMGYNSEDFIKPKNEEPTIEKPEEVNEKAPEPMDMDLLASSISDAIIEADDASYETEDKNETERENTQLNMFTEALDEGKETSEVETGNKETTDILNTDNKKTQFDMFSGVADGMYYEEENTPESNNVVESLNIPPLETSNNIETTNNETSSTINNEINNITKEIQSSIGENPLMNGSISEANMLSFVDDSMVKEPENKTEPLTQPIETETTVPNQITELNKNDTEKKEGSDEIKWDVFAEFLKRESNTKSETISETISESAQQPISSNIGALNAEEEELKMTMQAKIMVETIIKILFIAPEYRSAMLSQAGRIGSEVASAMK